MNLGESERIPQTHLQVTPLGACRHSRVISGCVSDEEHQAGKVRCVECGSVIPDPHLQRDAKGA